jgi:hypothetical protein
MLKPEHFFMGPWGSLISLLSWKFSWALPWLWCVLKHQDNPQTLPKIMGVGAPFFRSFWSPPIVFPTKGVQLFISQGLSVLPFYSWNYCGHEKQMPTRRNTLTCSYSLIVILVLNYVQEAVIWGIMIKWQSLESNKHFSWNSQCSYRLWRASTWTIHSWHSSESLVDFWILW